MNIESLNLYALKYFFDAVESGSLSAAALKNFVTRSAISQALVRLEEWAGFTLITHEKRNFKLTTNGEFFYRRMKKSYDDFTKAIESHGVESNQIRVGCSNSLLEKFLTPELRRIKPFEDFHLVLGPSSKLKNALKDEQVRLILFIEEGTAKDENVFLLKEGSFVLASRNGQLPAKIISTEMRPEVMSLKQYFVKRRKPKSYIVVESWTVAAKLATELGMACLVPDFLLSRELRKIDLPGFSHKYKVMLQHVNRERLSEAELRLIAGLTG